MRKLEFLSKRTKHTKCPLCRAENDMTFLDLASGDFVLNEHQYTTSLYRCHECECVYYHGIENIGYLSLNEDNFKKYVDHYLLIGCGIDTGLRLLDMYGRDKHSLLEIGCGTGFLLDYWCNFRGREGVGLEAAYYGRVGAELLNVDIKDSYLTSKDTPARKYDVVLATEVIEHVSDPRDFLEAMKLQMKQDGILLLTTPAAEFIQPGANLSTALAALSPGFHYFLFSRKLMEKILKEAGFVDIRIEIINERMYIKAGLEDGGDISEKFNRLEYISYLEYLASNPNEIVVESALIRLFEEYVNTARFDDAEKVYDRLSVIIKNKYKIDLPVILSDVAGGQKFNALGEYLYTLPPYFGVLLYYLGICHSRTVDQLINRVICFGLAYQFLASVTKLAPQFSQKSESLLTLAGREYFRAQEDNLIYFKNYIIGKCSGIGGEFQSQSDFNQSILENCAGSSRMKNFYRVAKNIISRAVKKFKSF